MMDQTAAKVRRFHEAELEAYTVMLAEQAHAKVKYHRTLEQIRATLTQGTRKNLTR